MDKDLRAWVKSSNPATLKEARELVARDNPMLEEANEHNPYDQSNYQNNNNFNPRQNYQHNTSNQRPSYQNNNSRNRQSNYPNNNPNQQFSYQNVNTSPQLLHVDMGFMNLEECRLD